MCNDVLYSRNGAAKRCAICDGKFGLIRHYSWRTALCSKKCCDRFKTREEGDRRWLGRLQAAGHAVFDTMSAGIGFGDTRYAANSYRSNRQP
jgi:hypothetical protein